VVWPFETGWATKATWLPEHVLVYTLRFTRADTVSGRCTITRLPAMTSVVTTTRRAPASSLRVSAPLSCLDTRSPGNAALRGAAPFCKYRTLESEFLDGFYADTVVLLGSQQSLPAMCQAQPKLSIVFIVRVGGEFSALLDLILEEIGCFEHCGHHNKSPAHRGFDEPKTQWAGICSDRDKDPDPPLDVPVPSDPGAPR
jgi:hypothetical protein